MSREDREDDKRVQEGQVAAVHFVGRVAEGPDEGEAFDTTDVDVAMEEGIYHDYRDYKPLEFRVGEGKVLEGLDEAVVGMEPGDEKTVEVPPERAYGERDESKVVELPREEFDEEKLDEERLVSTDDGRTGWVVDVGDKTVTVDFNHELAGKHVEFEVRLLAVHGAPGEGSARTWDKKKGRRVEDRREKNGDDG